MPMLAKKRADERSSQHNHGLPVLNHAEELVGIITFQDLDRAQLDGSFPNQTVGDVATRELVVAYPDDTMDLALQKISVRDLGRMPVVDRDNPRHLLGMLRRTDIVRAYDLALTRRVMTRHQAQQIRLGAYSGVNVEELQIETGSACAGKPVKAIAWHYDSILVTLRRGREVIIPHGDTVLKAGDVLVVAAEGDARGALRRLCQVAAKPDQP